MAFCPLKLTALPAGPGEEPRFFHRNELQRSLTRMRKSRLGQTEPPSSVS